VRFLDARFSVINRRDGDRLSRPLCAR
jgi:hypothetical protein